jgi:uncharacterized protein with ATP-grasp and redox domains
VDTEISDEKVKSAVLRDALHYLGDNFSSEHPPSRFITGVHRIFKTVSKIKTPFESRRTACNEGGVKLAEELKHRARAMRGLARFSFFVRWAIAGNHLDFRTVGTGYGFDMGRIEAMLESAAQRLVVDRTEDIFRETMGRPRILYVHDNVGEIALDALLIEEMKVLGAYVVSGVRGGPITSDATMEDAKSVGLDAVADEVIRVGPDTLGISFEEMSKPCLEEIQKADLVVAKGQANYYNLSENRQLVPGRIACLLRTKCDLVAGILGGEGHISVATFL